MNDNNPIVQRVHIVARLCGMLYGLLSAILHKTSWRGVSLTYILT